MKSLREKLESATKGFLGGWITEQLVTTAEDAPLAYPYVLAAYTDGETYGPQTGLTRATVVVQVVSKVSVGKASTGAEEHNALFGRVVAQLERVCLAADLTQAGDNLLVVGIESTTEDATDVVERGDHDIFTSNYSIQLLTGHN